MSPFFESLWSAQAPLLPQAWATRLAMQLGWAMLLALMGAALARRAGRVRRCALALALGASCALPGPWSPAHWLGLACYVPSLSTLLLGAWGLWRLLRPDMPIAAQQPAAPDGMEWYMLLAGSALGYALLADSFALWPQALYGWGFSPALLAFLLLATAVPWVARGYVAAAHTIGLWVAPMALLLFVLTRLPTGNVWDALLDPWLWLVLQGLMLRRLYRRWRA